MLTGSSLDVFALSETKLDESFTMSQFQVSQYSLYRRDRNAYGGGVMVFIKNIIPHCCRNDFQNLMVNQVEGIVLELTISKNKWLICLLYKPPNVTDSLFVSMFVNLIESMLNETKYIMVLGDLNFNMNCKNKLSETCCLLGLKNMVQGDTCHKGESSTSIDVILTSNSHCLNNTLNESVGISDFHNLIGCSFKAHAPVKYHKRLTYRSYKKFIENDFLDDLKETPLNACFEHDCVDTQYEQFNELFSETLNKHAPLKSKTITKVSPPFMNGDLRKSIYKKCMLRNKYYKQRTAYNWEKYKAQRNLVTSIRRRSIREYFQRNTTTIDNNFWKTMKPFLSNKRAVGNDDIILREGEELLTNKVEVCNTFNDFYTTIVSSIGFDDTIPRYVPPQNLLSYILCKYRNHPSIEKIMLNHDTQKTFAFYSTTENEVSRIISKLNIKKAIGHDRIPAKILKLSVKCLTPVVTRLINYCIDKCLFPSALKLAEVSSVYKKNDKLCKENYRPISILVITSKVYEKIFVNQMSSYVSEIFNPLLSAYRIGYGCNDVLLKFVLLWKKALDDNLYVGSILMDLSKAFDCLPHCLLIAKLYAYGFSEKSCLLIASYLSERKQRVKLGNVKSSWKDLKKGVPQGSIMGPVLFNFFIHDLYYFMKRCYLLNYADDDTLVFSHTNINELYSSLKIDADIAVNWFESNGMKANPDKFQFIVSHRNKDVTDPIVISGMSIAPEQKVKLLGITIDKKLTFDTYVENICRNASKQLNVLKRFSKILGQKQKLRVFQSFIVSNFNYCPVVWNFCSKGRAQLIEKIQERGLRYVYNSQLSYYDLLKISNRETMCNMRLKKIAIYVYKCINKISPAYLHDVFKVKSSPYLMRSEIILVQPKVNTISHGLNSFNYHGAKIWNRLPENIKSCGSLQKFKKLLSMYKQPLCDCSYCLICI
jgi:hypothetical protein